jgi:uncharacterized protein (DUF983 family)
VSYTVAVPDGEEHGIRVTCDRHGESETFQSGYRTVVFYCEECDREIEITVHDGDWRDMQELC